MSSSIYKRECVNLSTGWSLVHNDAGISIALGASWALNIVTASYTHTAVQMVMRSWRGSSSTRSGNAKQHFFLTLWLLHRQRSCQMIQSTADMCTKVIMWYFEQSNWSDTNDHTLANAARRTLLTLALFTAQNTHRCRKVRNMTLARWRWCQRHNYCEPGLTKIIEYIDQKLENYRITWS